MTKEVDIEESFQHLHDNIKLIIFEWLLSFAEEF